MNALSWVSIVIGILIYCIIGFSGLEDKLFFEDTTVGAALEKFYLNIKQKKNMFFDKCS